MPVVLTGDFNLEPDSKPIQAITEKIQDTKELGRIVNFGPSGTYNNFDFTNPVPKRIDYIFTSNNVDIMRYAILCDSKDCRYPSDHFPVITEIKNHVNK